MASTGTYDRAKAVCMNMKMTISEEQQKCIIPPSSCHNTADAVQMLPEEIHQQSHHINKEPLISDIKDLLPFSSLILVNKTTHEPEWNYLFSKYHYLGYRKLLGHSLKYLVFVNNPPVAAFSWSAPALKLRFRGEFITAISDIKSDP